MDPQKLSQLDPKLREAYERVMGTPSTPDPIPPPQPIPPVEQPAIPSPTEPIQPVASETPVTPITEPATTNFDQMNSEAATQTQTPAVKKKNIFMSILIVLGIVVFVAIYTLIWTKIFNLRLPFLG